MPWKNVSPMEQKQQFVSLFSSDQFTMSELCKTFGISRKTGHKWRDRYAVHGMSGLVPQSRAPKSVTYRIDEAVERLIVAERPFIRLGKRRKSSMCWGPKTEWEILQGLFVWEVMTLLDGQKVHQAAAHSCDA